MADTTESASQVANKDGQKKDLDKLASFFPTTVKATTTTATGISLSPPGKVSKTRKKSKTITKGSTFEVQVMECGDGDQEGYAYVKVITEGAALDFEGWVGPSLTPKSRKKARSKTMSFPRPTFSKRDRSKSEPPKTAKFIAIYLDDDNNFITMSISHNSCDTAGSLIPKVVDKLQKKRNISIDASVCQLAKRLLDTNGKVVPIPIHREALLADELDFTKNPIELQLISKNKIPIGKFKKKKTKHIGDDHPEFELTYDMMLGIRHAVSRWGSEEFKEIDLAKDHHKLKKMSTEISNVKFPARGSAKKPQTPPHKMRDFQFRDYAPQIFRQIRHNYGLDEAEYLLTVCGDFSFLEFVSNSKSGEFFFFTSNQQFMIKTISQAEADLLYHNLEAYFVHIKNNPNSLLVRFFGMHQIKSPVVKHNRGVNFLIMSSVFYTHLPIHTIYDLKGSTLGRTVKKENVKAGCVFKDQDFLEHKVQIKIGRNHKAFHKQVKQDVRFLQMLKIMDYSMLVGIHYGDKVAKDQSKGHSATNSLNRPHRRSMSNRMLLDLASEELESTDQDGNVGSPPSRNRTVSVTSRPADTDFEDFPDLEDEFIRSPAQPKGRKLESSVANELELGASGIKGVGVDEVYFMGVIDILIAYGIKKKFETRFKTLTGNEKITISAVDPVTYANRFIDFMEKGVVE